MGLIRCKCGRITNNGLSCAFCSAFLLLDKDGEPEEETEEVIHDEDLEEGFRILCSSEENDD